MAVDHVKSAVITALDTQPLQQLTAGEGAPGALKYTEGFATAIVSSSADATYQLVRLPSNAKVKRVLFESEAQAAGKFDLGVYYATDSLNNKYPTALLAAAAIDQDFFASVIDCASAVARTDVTNESGTNTLDKRNMPLWQALGLSVDPRTKFDIVATVKTTAVTTGTGKLGVSVEWTT